MKRIDLTLLMSVISIAAVAQMQPDSTFYIISYWEPGENCMYEYYKSEYEIHDGDTTEVTFSRNLQEFKVLSATESSYQLSVDYLDEYSSDPKNNILNQMIIDANGDNRLVFSTDQHGAYLSVDNKDELTAMFVGLVDPMLQYMYEEELKNGVSLKLANQRLRHGWTREEAATTPLERKYGSKRWGHSRGNLNRLKDLAALGIII